MLLLGMSGQIGWELQRSLAPLGELAALGRDSAEFARPGELAAVVRCHRPDVIVNAAACTAVDRAESEQDLARIVNAKAVSVLAREAAASGAWLIHYSTDYVFDGSGTAPWREDATPRPLNAYGRSKLEGETAIRASGCHHLILRTGWVYGTRRSNFARAIVRQAVEQPQLLVVDDQFGAPTGAELLADVTAHALRQAVAQPALGGTYHVTAGGQTSWHGYACHVLDFVRQAGMPIKLKATQVERIASVDRPTPARRPLNCRLDTQKIQSAFGLSLPDWHLGVDRMLRKVLG